MRNCINWNQGWSYSKGEPQKWTSVTLPHTWNAYDGQDGGNDYYQGIGWYQKYFNIDPAWKQVYVRFGAASKKAEVWCNGQSVGQHLGGFAAFTLDLTKYIKKGDNELLVKVDNHNSLPIYPRQADFTFFGGLYRDVELICFEEETHVDVAAYGTDALFVTPTEDGTVTVDVHTVGEATASVRIYDAKHLCVAESESVMCRGEAAEQMLTFHLQVENPHRWNGVADAYLYTAAVALTTKTGVPADEVSAAFGFRSYQVTADRGFFLNGDTYPLHGVCRHQDRENMGWALTEKEHLEDMALIQEIGANTIRLAHYQQAPFFYDLCDHRGLVVWAEIPFISVYDDCREADDNLRQQMRELVLQNYNHPSICFWGIANEIGIGGESEQLYSVLRELNQLTQSLDPTRLTVIANVGMTKTDSPLFHIADVAGYNEYMGWYEGKMEDHGPFCDERHSQIPEVPLAISEYGAESILSWHSSEPKLRDYTEEYQALLHEKAQAAFAERPYIWATWLWNMFDFAADARDEGGCKGRNNKGLVSYDRTIRKQGFYYYKACWSREAFVYVCGKRFTKRDKGTTDIKVYSNSKQVTLWVNAQLFEQKQGNTVFEFEQVPLDKKINEILVKTENGCSDTLILERVDAVPEEYLLREVKTLSDAVTQWFAGLQQSGSELVREIVVYEGYLSVYDPMEEVYRYPEAYQAVQELVAKPLAINNPAMASRMAHGGAMSFSGIWNHINKLLPDDVIYLVNERLNKINK